MATPSPTPVVAADPERGSKPSASAEHVWACAGAMNLIRECGNPQSAPDEEAAVGTVIHRAFETGNTLELTEEQEETYHQGLNFLGAIVAGWEQDFGVSTAGRYDVQKEQRLWCHHPETMEPLCSAKLDWFVCWESHALICDYKTGWTPNLTPSPRSTQLRIQALCLKEEYPGLEHIRVAFVKPKLKAGAEDWCDYTQRDLELARGWMEDHLWRSSQPDAPRTPGKHCRYCPGRGFCPEAASYALLPSVIASRAVSGATIDPVEAVAKLQPVDLLKIWQSSSLIEQILKAVSVRLKAMPDSDLAALGLTRGKPRELSSVKAVGDAFRYLQQQGWSDEDVFGAMKFGITNLAGLARKYKSLSSDKAASGWVKTALAEFIETKPSEAPLKELKE